MFSQYEISETLNSFDTLYNHNRHLESKASILMARVFVRVHVLHCKLVKQGDVWWTSLLYSMSLAALEMSVFCQLCIRLEKAEAAWS